MDYGKVAYYKAEELAESMSKLGGSSFASSTVFRNFGESSTPELVSTLKGSGLLIASIVSTGSASLYVSGVCVFECSGGGTTCLSVGDCDVSVMFSAGGSIQLTFCGDSVSASSSQDKYRAVAGSAGFAVAYTVGDVLYVYESLTGSNVEYTKVLDYDLALMGYGLMLVYIDSAKHGHLCGVDLSSSDVYYSSLSGELSEIAISNYNFTYLVTVRDESSIRSYQVDSYWTINAFVSLPSVSSVCGIRSIAGSINDVLICYDGGIALASYDQPTTVNVAFAVTSSIS